MQVTSAQRHSLKQFVDKIKDYRGRHTELVSVYIPAGYEMNKIIQHLSQEQGTASNIKSTTTRKNVIAALERMIQHLKLFTKTPPHGLAVFSGNVAEREGQQNIQVWSIEPPLPLKIRIYRCDKAFVISPLVEMIETKESYGMVVLDRREANIALLNGKSLVTISSAKSNVPGKTKAGGQSAARFMRLREDAAKDFYKKVANMMKEAFLGREGLKGIIIGGPGPTKYEFIETGYITGDLKKRIIAIKDIGYTGDFGLQELLDKSADILQSEEVIEEKNIMQKFLGMLSKSLGRVAYGEDEVKHAISIGAVETLLLSEALPEEKIEEFSKLAEETAADVKIISVDTREGVQLRDIGMVAAILRFETGGTGS